MKKKPDDSLRDFELFVPRLIGILVTLGIVVGLCLLLLLASSSLGWSKDLGQWEKMDPEQKRWFSQLMQPDTIGYGNTGISCCGEGDAYWADEQHVRDGKIYAVITDERDDAPLGRMHEDVGTEYEVPPKKIVGMEQRVGNPTGHTVLFLAGPSSGEHGQRLAKRAVLCFVQNGGI